MDIPISIREKEESHLSCGRGHGARENNNTLRDVFLLQDVEQPEGN